MATSVKKDDDLPEGFALDELPEGFTVDATPAQADTKPSIPGRSAAAPPPAPPGFFDFITGSARAGHEQNPLSRILQQAAGLGEAGLSLATGGTAGLVAGPLAVANRVGSDVSKLGFGMEPDRSPMEQTYLGGMGAVTYQPRTTAGQEMAASAGQFLGANAPSLVGLPRMPPGALGQATQAMRETPGVAVPQSVRAAAGAAADAITPALSAEMSRLYGVADKFGIKMQPHQVAGGRVTKAAGEFAESVPLAGSGKDARKTAFTKAVIRQINPEEAADRLTPEVYDAALERSGGKVGEVAGKAVINLKGKLQSELNALWKSAERSGEGDSPRIIPNLIEDIVAKAGDDGAIPGKTVREAISDLGRKARSTQNGDYRNRLNQMQDILLDAVESGISKEDATAFQTARKEYAIAKQLEPMVAKMVDGEVPPAALLGRVTASKTAKEYVARGMGGDIADLAKIGQLIKDPPSSGTAERSLTYRAASGGAKLATEMAGGYPASVLYNLLGPTIARRMAEKGRATPVIPPEPRLTTGLGFETVNQGPPLAPPAGVLQRTPLGDLTPDYGTGLGFEGTAPPLRGPQSTMPAAGPRPLGLDPTPVGQADQPMRILPGGFDPRNGTAPMQRPATPQMPSVPGRPDLPDVMPVESFGAPKGVFADQPTITAAGTPEAQLARSQQLGSATGTQQDLILALSRELERLQAQGRPAAAPAPAQASARAGGAPTVTTPSSLKAEKSAQRANNASGESAASQEAINRVASEKAAGRTRARWSGGKVMQLTGPDAVDQRVGPKDIVLQRGVGKNKWTVLNQGKDVKQSDIARAIAEAEKQQWK